MLNNFLLHLLVIFVAWVVWVACSCFKLAILSNCCDTMVWWASVRDHWLWNTNLQTNEPFQIITEQIQFRNFAFSIWKSFGFLQRKLWCSDVKKTSRMIESLEPYSPNFEIQSSRPMPNNSFLIHLQKLAQGFLWLLLELKKLLKPTNKIQMWI